MMRGAAVAVAIVAAIVLAWAALAGADPPTGTVTTYSVASGATGSTGTTGVTGLGGLAGGPDGNPWFLEAERDANAETNAEETFNVGTVASGTVVEHPTGLGLRTVALASAGGLLWFTATNGDSGYLDSITTGGALSKPMEVERSLGGMAADSSGDLWIAHPQSDTIDEVAAPDYSGEIDAESGDPLQPDAEPQSVTAGPGSGPTQTIWFTEPGVEAVASITQAGAVTQYPLGDYTNGTLGNIVLGPDGNLWVGVSPSAPGELGGGLGASLSVGLNAATTSGRPALLRITPANVITEFDLPAASTANPDVLATGPDGELWMADLPGTDGGLTAVSTAGVFTTYPGVLPPTALVSSMIRDPAGDDALWLTDAANAVVYRVALQPPTTATPPQTTTTATTTASATTAAAPSSPPTLTAALGPVSAVVRSGATLAGAISVPAGSPSTTVTYDFQYGTSTAYGSATPSATASATPSGVSVSAPLTGLTPYTTYHYRMVASDCSAVSCQAVSPDQTFTTGSTLQPLLHSVVGATTTAGEVLVKLRGKHHFVRLTTGELIPLGSTIDARHGTILIQSATAQGSGQLASGLFSGGIFVVTQPAEGTTTVLELSSSFKRCPAGPLAHSATAMTTKKKTKAVSHKVVNQVFGNAHGHFSTRGHYATAADQGTRWRTADRCDGTLIAVSAGKVTVTDFIRHRTFVLTAGHHYLAHTR